MTSKLKNLIQNFDGVAVSILSEARTVCQSEPDYLDDLTALCFASSPTVSNGATWILKAELESSSELPPELTNRIVTSLGKLQSWQAKLHLCQSEDRLRLTEDQANLFIEWARTLAEHRRPFVRAWSLHARVVIGRKFEKHRQDAADALNAAKCDPAASVRARARNLQQPGKKNS